MLLTSLQQVVRSQAEAWPAVHQILAAKVALGSSEGGLESEVVVG